VLRVEERRRRTCRQVERIGELAAIRDGAQAGGVAVQHHVVVRAVLVGVEVDLVRDRQQVLLALPRVHCERPDEGLVGRAVARRDREGVDAHGPQVRGGRSRAGHPLGLVIAHREEGVGVVLRGADALVVQADHLGERARNDLGRARFHLGRLTRQHVPRQVDGVGAVVEDEVAVVLVGRQRGGTRPIAAGVHEVAPQCGPIDRQGHLERGVAALARLDHHLGRRLHADGAVGDVVGKAERRGHRVGAGRVGVVADRDGRLEGHLLVRDVDEPEAQRAGGHVAGPRRRRGGHGVVNADLAATDAGDRGESAGERVVDHVGVAVVHEQRLHLERPQAMPDGQAVRRAVGRGLLAAGGVEDECCRTRDHRGRTGRATERALTRAGTGDRGDGGTRGADLRLDEGGVLVLRAAGRAADHAAGERDPDCGIEADHRVRQAALQPVRERLGDHVARDRDVAAAVTALEGIAGSHEADDADEAASRADVRDLDAEGTRPTVDEDDLPRERTGRERVAAEQVAARAVAVLHRRLDHRGERCRPRLPDRREAPGDGCRGDDLHERQERARHRGLRHGQRARRGRRGAVGVRLVAAVARGRDGQHTRLGGVLDGGGEVVVERLAVGRAERHVDDVDAVAELAVTVGVQRELHALDQGDARAGGGDGGADLHGVQVDVRSDAAHAADDVRDVGAVAGLGAVIEGVRVRHLDVVRPQGADEVVAAHHLGGREGAGLDDGRVVGGVLGRVTRATKGGVGVVDAAVEDGDLDAVARHAVRLDVGGTDVRHGLGEVELVGADRRDALHRGVAGQLRQDGGVHLDEDGVEDHLGLGDETRARVEGGDAGHQVRLRPAEVLFRAGRGGVAEVLLGHGGLLQAHDHPGVALRPDERGVEVRDGDSLEGGRGVEPQVRDARREFAIVTAVQWRGGRHGEGRERGR